MKTNFELTAFHYPFIRVAIVEDHIVVAEGFERIINTSENARVVAKAYNVAGCRELLEAANTDVLLLDISMPDGNGIEICSQIKEKYPQIKVLMLTSYGELSTITRALDACADGYILKSCTQEELLEGICAVASGKRFLCHEVNVTINKSELQQIELTRRERDLLLLIMEGCTLTEQAERLHLGQNTIRNYRQKLNVKLDAHNTVQLVQNAKALNLV